MLNTRRLYSSAQCLKVFVVGLAAFLALGVVSSIFLSRATDLNRALSAFIGINSLFFAILLYAGIYYSNKSISEKHTRKVFEETTIALGAVAERKDPYTAGHQRRVAKLAVSIAKEIGLNEEQIKGLYIASIIHDVGKIGIPAEILSKPGRLTELEFAIIKTHSQSGYDILKPVDYPWPVALAVYQHHEKLNGTGYPRALTSEKIILESRILTVADVVEAMASHRPYRPALGVKAALREITDNKGILFDPEVVQACVNVFTRKRFRF
ncbi:MAG: HD-GYP domain-containing protein [Candidatus Omnitrophica bacterium]|nr:HD-GYP domain-containing protein [Candidatus Omnitrophota bacterium]